jgi:hypothetical protein
MFPADSLVPEAHGAGHDAGLPQTGPGGLTTAANPTTPPLPPPTPAPDQVALPLSATTAAGDLGLPDLLAGAPPRRSRRRRGPRLVAPQDKPAPLGRRTTSGSTQSARASGTGL